MDEIEPGARVDAEVAVDYARIQDHWAETMNGAEADVMAAIQDKASAAGLKVIGLIEIDWVQRYQSAGKFARTVEHSWSPIDGEPDHWRPGFQFVCKGTALVA